MRTLTLTINNVDVVHFTGDDLAPRDVNPHHWSHYSALEIREAPDSDTWLHFDVEAKTDKAPSDIEADSHDERTSSVIFTSATKAGDVFEIHVVKSDVVLRFRWRNPLTPASKGAWIRLVLRRDHDVLFVVNEDKAGNNESRIWTFDTDWRRARIQADVSPRKFANDLPTFKYAAANGSGCALFDFQQQTGLVFNVGNHADHFRLFFLDATPDDKIRRLAARFLSLDGVFPLNDLALGGGPFGQTTLKASSVELTCARRKDQLGFIVEWTKTAAKPPSTDPRELSLDTLYNALARHYPLGMASARSRNRLSFAPTHLSANAIRLQFDVGDATRLRQIIVDQGADVTWTTGAASEPESAAALTFTQAAQALPLRDVIFDSTSPGALLDLGGDGKPIRPTRWVVNGVALDATAFEHADLIVHIAPGAEIYGQSPVTVDFRLDFKTATISPVSDDPEIGFETVSAQFNRERPIVIDLREPATNPTVRLEVHEFASAQESRILRIGVRSLQQEKSNYDIDAVVLDPSPFTAARVRSTTKIDRNGLFAEYTDDDEAAEWAFATEKGEMNVVLPPQVIGEEMIKGRLFAMIGNVSTEVPIAGEPFDFRLSPPARLTLDRTDIDTARALPPWSLRRLLGLRPGVAGVKLQKAQFELLYGLLTSIEDISGLRVADLEALVGRVPFPDVFVDILRKKNEPKRKDDKPDPLLELRGKYCDTISHFIRGMLYRPSWWPVFRDFTSRQQVIISGKGVSASLRPSRATASPFELGSPHDPRTVTDTRTPLRGGVDFPFQSRAVYNELLSKPDSSSVSIEGLAFGTLGGWGKQAAEFNNGKTLIISETTMGRLDAVTVIRIGRIAMLWNRARHVIVYERSTRRAPRYTTDPGTVGDTLEFQSDKFDGFAALRKVREYIEITERKRAYPDTSATRPIAGPLKASFFETTIIPVKSSWGRDVATGFVIALRGPLKEGEDKFFPFPKIFLEQARARGKGEGTVNHQLKDPSELLFYTSTLEKDGGDSDQWAAVADIDFPLIPPPSALPLPFKSRFSRSRKQPDARVADFGQSRFTITLDPPEEAVDLMHGRPSDGIEARVSSVSLARGRVAQAPNVPAGGVTARLVPLMSEAHAVVHDGLAELRMQLAQARQDGITSLAELPSFKDEAQSLITSLTARATGELKTALTQVPVSSFDWGVEQKEWNRKYNANLQALGDSWRKQLDVSSITDAAEQKRIFAAALESVCGQVRQRIKEANFLPLQALDRIDIAHASLVKRLDDFENTLLLRLGAGLAQVKARFHEILDASGEEIEDGVLPFVPGLGELQKELDGVVANFMAPLARFDGDAIKQLIDNLGEWFSTGDTGLIADISNEIRELATELQLLAEEIVSAIPPIDDEEPDWDQLVASCKALLDDFKTELLPLINAPIDKLRQPIMDLMTGSQLTILKSADDAVETACKDGSAITTFIPAALEELSKLGDQLKSALDNLGADWKAAAGPFNKVGEFTNKVDTWFSNLAQSLQDEVPIEEVEAAVEAASKTIIDGIEGAAKQVERAVVDEVRNLGSEITAAGLELTRVLATGPVNDAIACTRERLGYYYKAAQDLLDVTRASAIFNDLGGTVLNSLSAELPFDRIRDRLLPQLDGVDLSQLLPNFGGLKLEYLFPDLAAPNDEGSDNDWIRIRHGFDKDRLTAFANVDVDKVLDGAPTVFILPPISLKVRNAHFLASSRLELSSGGGKSQSTKASLNGDWMLCLSDRPIVTMNDATLLYDSDGGFDFAFDSDKVELAEEFQFITQALKSFLPDDEGMTLTPIMPAGIRAELGLPLPDLTTGAFTLTGITLYAFMELLIADGFEVKTGFWLSKPERPFGLAILFLGGGGWVGVEVAYRPPSRFITRFSIGISAGAFVAVNLGGVAHGSAGILFTAGVDFFRNSETQGGQTLITLGVLVWGEFSILGIASASLRLMMSVTYNADTGSMIGTGSVEVSIKICWCFTLRVSQRVTQTFAGGNRPKQLAQASNGRDRFDTAVRAAHSNVAL
jgi:hypothetical protein